MEKVIAVLQVVVPIFAAVFLGILARKKNLMTPEENMGLRQFVMNFGLPCTLFNSCLTAQLGAESLTSFALVLPLMFVSILVAFRLKKKRYPYHNLPMLFAAQESGMLGIPLFMTLFGADQAYRMGVLDLAQTPIAIPIIALLSADAEENPTPAQIVKKVFHSPLLLVSLLGLALNLSGAADWMDAVGIGPVLTSATGFIAQPVSAVMLFSVGYNFSLAGNRGKIFRLAGFHFALMALFGLLVEGALLLLPAVDPATRWAVLMYFTLPASYIAPGLGRTQEERTVASGVCSILTVVSLIFFCAIAVAVA